MDTSARIKAHHVAGRLHSVRRRPTIRDARSQRLHSGLWRKEATRLSVDRCATTRSRSVAVPSPVNSSSTTGGPARSPLQRPNDRRKRLTRLHDGFPIVSRCTTIPSRSPPPWATRRADRGSTRRRTERRPERPVGASPGGATPNDGCSAHVNTFPRAYALTTWRTTFIRCPSERTPEVTTSGEGAEREVSEIRT